MVPLQVYFMDNEDLFKRKQNFHDESGNAFKDNAERTIFFCKGALETVKKFGWPPDIIHVLWMSALIPMYIKSYYKKEPVFANSKKNTRLPKAFCLRKWVKFLPSSC